MAAPKKVEWDTCEEDDCIGVRLPSGGACWAHADDHDLDTALKRLGKDGNVDARGVAITKELLERLLATAPREDDGGVILAEARFDGLRAWRALTTFVVLLLVAAGLFAFGGGFASSTTARGASPSATTLPASGSSPSSATTATVDTSFGGALIYSARTVIGLTRDPQPWLPRPWRPRGPP